MNPYCIPKFSQESQNIVFSSSCTGICSFSSHRANKTTKKFPVSPHFLEILNLTQNCLPKSKRISQINQHKVNHNDKQPNRSTSLSYPCSLPCSRRDQRCSGVWRGPQRSICDGAHQKRNQALGLDPSCGIYSPQQPKRLHREDTTQPLKRKERFSLEPDSISADLALENNVSFGLILKRTASYVFFQTRPGHKSVEASKERTIKGIELRLGSGQNLAVSKKDLRNNEPSYVKYSAFRSEGSAKIIRMQEVSIDPLELLELKMREKPLWT